MPDEVNKDVETVNNEEDADVEGDEVLDDKDYQPEVRKTVGEYVAERRAKRAEKKLEDGGEEEGNEEKEEKPDLASLIQEEVKKAINPLSEFAKTQATDSEINAFLANNSQFKKFERLARKDALAYPNVPIAKIFRSLAFDDAGKTVKANVEKAKEGAKVNKMGGVSKRSGFSAPLRPHQITKEQQDNVRIRARMGEKIDPLELE